MQGFGLLLTAYPFNSWKILSPHRISRLINSAFRISEYLVQTKIFIQGMNQFATLGE